MWFAALIWFLLIITDRLMDFFSLSFTGSVVFHERCIASHWNLRVVSKVKRRCSGYAFDTIYKSDSLCKYLLWRQWRASIWSTFFFFRRMIHSKCSLKSWRHILNICLLIEPGESFWSRDFFSRLIFLPRASSLSNLFAIVLII